MAQVFSQNIVEVVIKHLLLAGREAYNVLHVWNDEAQGNDESKARDVLDNWQDHIMNLMGADVVLQGAAWVSLDPDDNNMGELAPDPAKRTVGAAGADTLPPNSALHVRKFTSARQRGQRHGRMFLAGVPRAHVFDDGTLNGDFLTTAESNVDAFLNGVNDTADPIGGSSYLAVLNTTPESRIKGGPPVTLTSRKVTSLAVDSRIASQRDRLR